MKSHPVRIITFALVALASVSLVRADAVTDWNATLDAAQKATAQNPFAQARSGAIVHAAIFDAVNGIVKKYEPYRVAEPAPAGASAEAAAGQAAYTTLLALYPTQKAACDTQLTASLAALTGSGDAVASGRVWGENVAQQILAWRASDGFSATVTYLGSDATGYWRSTPAAGTSGAFGQFATMLPFTLKHPAQFRSGPPYGSADRMTALASAGYAADFNEVKAMGGGTSATRTAEQADIARFWAACDGADRNRAIRTAVPPAAMLVENARLFALANLASADAAIAAHDGKYTFGFWRPLTAIQLADTDNNAATVADPAWTSLIAAPQFPEYLSAHSVITAACFGVVALQLGDARTVTLSTPGFASRTATYASFSAAVAEVTEARIYGGIHFRTACVKGSDTGYEIASYVVGNFLRPLAASGEAPPRMANFSARASIGNGGTIVLGFVIEGARQKTLLIRGAGPTLAAFGVRNALGDPKLEIFSRAGQRLAENDNWSPTLARVFTSIGAFSLAAGGKDAALLLPLQPGLYSVVLSSVDGGSGDGLIEIYEMP